MMRIVAAVSLGCLACQAAAITDIQLMNNSSASFVTETSIRAREFRTEATTPSSGTVAGDVVSFTNRMAWMSAHRVFPGPSGLPLIHGNLVSYDLAFTVEDPGMLGYTLSVDSVFRGYLTALWQGVSRPTTDGVFAAGTLMGAEIDDGAGFGSLINALNTSTDVATATEDNPEVNLLVEKMGSYQVGQYAGTRTFILRFASVGNNTQAALHNYNIGEVNVRFGLDPTYGNFQNARYPGDDGQVVGTHGHFVTVTADFDQDTSTVPEPATFPLLGGAGIAIAAWKRRRRY
ncbi:MAG TPA: PEP-CTERM sorting domain-containing protein [Bryobacteraceae bacterium]|nr:PEP-CTERM sorting domain-containing protein [Bryobacteraceae bacterium]